MTRFAESVHEAFGAVPRMAGYRLVATQGEDASDFGDGAVEAVRGHLRLRFVRDRGQVWVDVARVGSRRWFDLGLVLRRLGVPALRVSEAEEKVALVEVLRALGRHLPAIEDMFVWYRYPLMRLELSRLEKHRARRRMERWRGVDDDAP